MGNFTISDNVFRQIIEYAQIKTEAIYKVNRVRIENLQTGMYIYIEVTVEYGYNLIEVLKNFKAKCKKEIENLTAMNVSTIDIVAKNIHTPVEGE